MSNLISTNNILETQCSVSFEILLSIAKDHIVIIKGIRGNSNYFVAYYKYFGYPASFPGCRWPRCALNASNLTPLTYTTLVYNAKWEIFFMAVLVSAGIELISSQCCVLDTEWYPNTLMFLGFISPVHSKSSFFFFFSPGPPTLPLRRSTKKIEHLNRREHS